MSTPQPATAATRELPDLDAPGRMEMLHYNLHYDNVTVERYRQAEEFIHACECVALWRLKQGQRSEDAGFYLGELAIRMAVTLGKLTEAGDLMLARDLPAVGDIIRQAESVYGRKLMNEIKERLTIEEILKEHRALDLIQMFAALHPDWAELCGIEDGAKLLRQPEEALRQLLLSEETWAGTRDGAEVVEKRKHRLAQIIENIQAIRQMQQPNINLFVEHLWQGRLWSVSDKTFEDCNWPTRPPREDVTAWMELIMPYLKSVTHDDPMKLLVFQHMLAARRCVYDGERIDENKGARLATAKTSDIWNQIRAEIRNAWVRMEKQARKRDSEKPA